MSVDSRKMNKNELGVCPKCSKFDLNYGGGEIVENGVKYPYVCGNCGFEGIEWYDLQFAGHWDTDGNEL